MESSEPTSIKGYYCKRHPQQVYKQKPAITMHFVVAHFGGIVDLESAFDEMNECLVEVISK